MEAVRGRGRGVKGVRERGGVRASGKGSERGRGGERKTRTRTNKRNGQ